MIKKGQELAKESEEGGIGEWEYNINEVKNGRSVFRG